MPDSSLACIESTASGIVLRVYVAPRASANKMLGLHDGLLKIALAAPPVDGAANKALVEFVAKTLGVPKGQVTLMSGETSRRKTLEVGGISRIDARKKLFPEREQEDE
ncbi:MAG TPA: DUF167 family protein [Chloroflexia bacterium]|nr:DUF167 family protein [Chloroflexia bacterium]